MHLELENLINMALADGEVTEKERAIILRKAEALGEDKDEVEMILDGKLALLKKIHEADFLPNTLPAPPLETKSNKEGDLKKCPSCGAPVQSFNINCPECGHEFRNINSVKSIELLNEGIKKIDKSFEGKSRDRLEKSDAIEQFIQNFPIPNSKEDIFEFIAFASSKAGWGNSIEEIWSKKCEEALTKLEFIGLSDPKVLSIVKNYREILSKKKKNGVLFIVMIVLFMTGMVALGIIAKFMGVI